MGGAARSARKASRLVFDVGVSNGDDSAYYLHKGFFVIGVEANPFAIERIKTRFAEAISAGRYRLVEAAIASFEGTAEFWVCHDQPDWSSFSREWASCNGAKHERVTVPTVRFRTILERFGSPLYAKIDIEGADDLCLEDLDARTAPPYVSVEVNDGEAQLRQLGELGYSRFKIISQTSLRQPSLAAARLGQLIPRALRAPLTAAAVKTIRRGRDGSWNFPYGSSGPFGEDTDGEWLSLQDALSLIGALRAGEHFTEWHDIHAARQRGGEAG